MNRTRQFSVNVNGNPYEVVIRKAEDGAAVVEVNGTKYDVTYEQARTTPKTPTLLRTAVYPTSEERPRSTSAPGESAVRGVKSPLPGVILDVKVGQGDVVKAGQVLVIMEAMKMENNIVAPVDGTISEVRVKPQDNVMEGDLLIGIAG